MTDGISGAAVNLGQLEAMIAVIDHGSFTAAADVLQISQPSLSRRIHALEATLGFRLFLPVGRRREITEEGRGVVSAARRTLAELASIDAMARSARALTTGTLRVNQAPVTRRDRVPGAPGSLPPSASRGQGGGHHGR